MTTKQEEHVQIGNETWIVRITGDWLQIIDSEGRERHRSRGHMLTGHFLAMAIAEKPFPSCPNLDAAMKKMEPTP